ncbi:MAG: methionine synthase [Schwartzia sp.]|nr:methionine synthase [Schwartzia sp. (in: firmicutes)]
MPIFNAPLTAVDAKETRRYAGLAKADFDETIIREACEEAALLAGPRGVWHRYAYDCQRQTIDAAEGVVLAGTAIGRHLAGCESVICLAATVGEAIEEAVTRHFQEGRYAYSTILDAAATAAVEQTADALERAVRPAVAKEGLTMRWRFSPGYGDWPLTGQTDLLRISGAAEIGIRLTESLMLLPRKSVTAVIGLSRQAETSAAPHGCAACSKTDCPARRTPPT